MIKLIHLVVIFVLASGQTGATRDQVSQFQRDIEPYRYGMDQLKTMSITASSDNPQCREAKDISRALADGAAFLEVIKQKYPGIENPSWSQDPNAYHHKVGDIRRYAENREQIARTCVNGLLRAHLRSEIRGIETNINEFQKREGYVLRRDFDDKSARHAAAMERWKENYAIVGI